MSTIPARGLALLRAACQSAFAFHYKGQKPRKEEDIKQKAATIGFELERALEAAAEKQSFDEIAALVLTAPGVDSAFIQQTAALDKEPITKVPGGAGAHIYNHILRDKYRVFIHTGSKFTEATHADLATAVRMAFTKLELTLPKGIPEE